MKKEHEEKVLAEISDIQSYVEFVLKKPSWFGKSIHFWIAYTLI